MATQDYIRKILSDIDIRNLKNGMPFKLLTYSAPANFLKLDKSDVFKDRYSIVDTKRLVIVGITVDFLKTGLICQTPFPTDFITFSISAQSVIFDYE